MKIKICGVRAVITAQKVNELGADFIGLVFAKSKRQVDLETAKSICLALDSSIKRVGVFVDESPEEIIRISNYCGLDYIQLHGSQTMEGYDTKQAIIRSISVDVSTDQDPLDEFIKLSKKYDHILFDTKVGSQEGGSGIAFNWERLRAIDLNKEKCFLAGGINIDNVLRAMEIANPYAIDVSSGVESNGVKDIEKIKAFIDLVRSVQDGI